MAANLKEVRNRIKSTISTQQITKAMKMVSAAKLRRAQQSIVQMRPYANKLNAMMSNIMSFSDGQGAGNFGKATEKKKPLMVVITSDRGLCGGFNSNIIKLAHKTITDNYSELAKNGTLGFLCIGKKGFEYFRRRFPNCAMNSTYVNLFSEMNYEKVSDIAIFIMNEFSIGNTDQIEVFYNRFKNAATQFPQGEQFLPVQKAEIPTTAGASSKPDFIFEPSQADLLKELIPSILKSQLYKCVLDNLASEHGSRMTAMDKATENAEEILSELKINYNKARQEAITKELSEIVGGAAALGG